LNLEFLTLCEFDIQDFSHADEHQGSMKYERFEQLPVWQAAIELAAAVYAMTEKPAFQKRYSLREQIERAAVSVTNNNAE
jgi:hypothetical protein